MPDQIRNTEAVITDLKRLISTKGYIYTLCLILFEDFHHDIEKLHEVDPLAKLSVKECTLILGFMVQEELDFSFPESPEAVIDLKEQTYQLMRELQISFNAPQMNKLRELFERQANGEVLQEKPGDREEMFVRDGAMVEPMFYAGDGVYDFQYLEYLEQKYKYDRDWLLDNKGFDFEEVCAIASQIKSILHDKAKAVHLINLKDVFAEVTKKAKNGFKKLLSSKETIEHIKREQLTGATFFQYRALFPDKKGKEKDVNEYWGSFYRNLLDLFIIRKSDFAEGINTDRFFSNFSFIPGANKNYNGPGHFNILNSCPLIRLDDETYFAPINYLIPEAIYESPFYWMWDDKLYRPKMAKHRGDVGEEMVYNLLSKVFGEENTFKSVLISVKKGEPDTDIDVVCILGNKALCVQVKSKKLTLSARRGDSEQLSADFKGAVQDAYQQGLVSRKGLLEGKAKFLDQNQQEIPSLKNGIDEVYIMGLTTENYPSLVHQVHMLLQKDKNDPFPLFISIFDLELLAHYLSDPYDFLYYVRQRIALIDYFRAEEELIYLGYHLQQKLWKIDGYDGGMLNTDFGALIDRNYYPYKIGIADQLSTKTDPIHNRWKGPKFDILLDNLKSSRHSYLTDIIFHLMDWSGNSREDIVGSMIDYKNIAIKENRRTSLATSTPPEFGLSYVVSENYDPQELETVVDIYSVLRKYKSKCDTWLGLGAFSSSPNLIDFMLYLDEPWIFDENIQKESDEFFNQPGMNKLVSLTKNKKNGRNDPCPCKSGAKYKRCCGAN